MSLDTDLEQLSNDTSDILQGLTSYTSMSYTDLLRQYDLSFEMFRIAYWNSYHQQLSLEHELKVGYSLLDAMMERYMKK